MDIFSWRNSISKKAENSEQLVQDFNQGLEATVDAYSIAPSADNSVVFFFGDGNGFSAGQYEIRLTFGAETIVLASMPFTILAE